MASGLKLAQDEKVVYTLEEVYVHENVNIPHDAILTNKHLFIVTYSILGNIKIIARYPLKSISVSGGRANLTIERWNKAIGYRRLVVRFKNGEKLILRGELQKHEDLSDFGSQLNAVLTGNLVPPVEVNNTISAEVIGMIKDVFATPGTKEQRQFAEPAKPERITVRCRGCGATISGYKGKTIRCEYCDTRRSL